MDFLVTRSWRGNIRELQMTIQRSVHLSKGNLIDITDFMVEAESVPALSSPGKIRDLEKDMILKTLKEVNGNKTRAARILGVSVRTIRNKLHEYGNFFPIPPSEKPGGAVGNPSFR